jgi:hypothetical protein
MIKIGKWEVPKNLFDEYIKWTMNADSYLTGKLKTPSDGLPGADLERSMRWQLCVQKVMEIHRKICDELGLEYTTDTDDEFYKEFHREVRNQVRLKG